MADPVPAQLPEGTYVVGGQVGVTGWICPQSAYGFEEDSEVKTTAAGGFNADITYSRRQTLSCTLEGLTGASAATFITGGMIAQSVIAGSTGAASGWKIRSATATHTRGPLQVELDLISLNDLIT